MKTVFFLDDNPEFLLLMKLFAEKKCECLTVTTSSYTQTLANENSILESDMAFLDINLGDHFHSGVDVYRWLRAHGYKKPIFFLTGHAKDSPDVRAAEALGDVKVLSKPLPNRELKELIGRCA